MSRSTKGTTRGERIRLRTLVLLLGIAIAWPALHHGLARRVGFDPWELFGWAMYTVPHPRTQVAIQEERDGSVSFLHSSGEEQRRIRAYARRRTLLGEWASPEPLARFLLDADPERDSLRVIHKRWRLDPESARWSTADEVLPFEREPAASE